MKGLCGFEQEDRRGVARPMKELCGFEEEATGFGAEPP